jgi:hypothetical protein
MGPVWRRVDALDWTRDLFVTLAAGHDVRDRLAPSFTATEGGVDLDADGFARLVRQQRAAWTGHDLGLLDAVWRRNLVFASWAWTDHSGWEAATGTVALAWDREGRLLSWTLL